MKQWLAVILVTQAALLASCAAYDTPERQTMQSVTYWINSYRVPCTGVGPMSCLQVRRDQSGPWSLFYSEIEGFEYEPGYLYEIKVREEARDAADTPADASTMRYVLLSIEEKSVDLRLRINDIWVLDEIEGREIGEADIADSNQRPVIEFHVRDGRYLGNDGCNSFRGSLEYLGEQEIRLGPAMSTKRMCRNMELPASFVQRLSRVDAYEINERSLSLLEGDQGLLHFVKTD